MSDRIKNIVNTALFLICLFGFFTLCIFLPRQEYSDSERRELKEFPELSISSILSGDFMSEFESYTLDQFPFRDSFRSLKAKTASYLFGKKDNNGIYIENGVASKIEYPLDEKSIEYASKKFAYIYENYLKDNECEVYLSVIPDKNAFLAEETGHLSFDYDVFYETVRNSNTFAKYIDIAPLLSLDDYYSTDTHWRQEEIIDVANTLASAMGTELSLEYKVNALENDFYGVYYGQSAMPMNADTICYLTNDTISSFEVYDVQNDRETSVYDMEKAGGKDPYEMFLSGSLSLITIKNEKATTKKELIVFRDSFGSSIVPLLAEGYSKVTLIDIRYISSTVLSKFVDFENKDVLFLYSTLVLNNSETMK